MVDATRVTRARQQAGNYTLTFTRRSPESTAAYVEKADGTRYAVVLGLGTAVCSCPDSMYRAVACKHAALVLEHLAVEKLERAHAQAWVRANAAAPELQAAAELELVATRAAYSRAVAFTLTRPQA